MPMKPRNACVLLGILLALSDHLLAEERPINVGDDNALRQALRDARPGSRIVIAPGKYRPGLSAANLHGAPDAPIVIEAADPKNKPLFEGGALAIHVSGCSHVTLRNLAVRGQSGNGINIDHGGKPDGAAHHITLEGIDVSEIGPRGNRDGIKLSGLDNLVVRNCTVEGWAGQGIDMVGCHKVLIENCTFRGKPGFEQSIAVQAKGGSSDVVIRHCNFLNSGQRGINVGGSTGLKFIRPLDATYEAKDITVEGCRFTGHMAAVAFVGVDGATFRYNTIHHPDKWIFRILQENTDPRFVPSRKGLIERNLIVFQRAKVREHVNTSPNTDPSSFTFKDNFWFCSDAPQTRPQLPSKEQGGVHGTDPGLKLQAGGIPSAPTAAAAKGFGADALPAAPAR